VTVYIEDCLIENFVVTFLILKGVAAFLRLNIIKWRLIIACLLASILACLYPLFNLKGFLLIVFKCAVGYIIVSFAYSGKNIVAKYILFIFLTALYAGLNILVYYLVYGTVQIYDNFPTYVLIGLLLLIYYLTNSLIGLLKKNVVLAGFVYKVTLVTETKQVHTDAFLDSGNTLKDQDSTPILIINFNLFNKLYSDISFEDLLLKQYKNLIEPHYIKSGFANGSGKILVFTIKKATIIVNESIKEIKNAKLGLAYSKFNKNFNCDMLLNVNCFI